VGFPTHVLFAVRQNSVSLSANVQYAWPHPSGHILYVVSSNGGPGVPGDAHYVSALRIDPATCINGNGAIVGEVRAGRAIGASTGEPHFCGLACDRWMKKAFPASYHNASRRPLVGLQRN
jgi:hypothetical protein